MISKSSAKGQLRQYRDVVEVGYVGSFGDLFCGERIGKER